MWRGTLALDISGEESGNEVGVVRCRNIKPEACKVLL